MHGVRYCRECDAEIPKGCLNALCTECFQESLRDQIAQIDTEPDPNSPPTERMTVQFDIDPYDPLMPTKDQQFGDYELLDQIAQGGMGLVFRARQTSLNRIVALKVIRAGQLASPTDVQRFRVEAEAAAHLDHPRIVPIYEIGELRGIHYFSMKLVEGGNLAQHLDSYVKDHQAAARLLAAAARGIHYAHQRGVLHRDLKPANILVDLDGRPHVTDFGVAKRVGGSGFDDSGTRLNPSNSGTLSGGIVGTPSYMAPEQAAGKRQGLTVAVDIYSLGAILFEMLTGRPPFKEATQMATLRKVLEDRPPRPRSINPKIDRTLEAICMKCLEREPYDRYHSAEDLVNDLDCWLANEPIEMQRGNAWVRTVKWTKRRPATATLAVATLFVTLLAMGTIVWQQQQVQAHELTLRQARETEEAERLKADAALGRLRVEQYADQLEAAQRSWQANNPTAMELALEACPVELRGWEWRLLKRLAQDGLQQPKLSVPDVTCLAFGKDGRTLFLANAQGRLATVEATTGRLLDEWPSEQGGVTALAVSADGERLVTTGADKTLVVWDARNGQRLTTFFGYPQGVSAIACSPRGQHLALASEELGRGGKPASVIHVWDLAHLAEPVTLRPRNETVTGLVFSPDGETLAAAGDDYVIRLWNWRGLETIKTPNLLKGNEGAVTSMAFAPDGQRFAASGKDRLVRVWHLGGKAEETPTVVADCSAPPQPIWFSADGSSLQAAIGLEVVRWNSATGAEQARFGRSAADSVLSACSADGKLVASVTSTGVLNLWNAARREDTTVLSGLATGSVHPLLSPDGQRLAVLNGQTVFTVFDAVSFRPLYQIKGREAPVAAVFAPNGRHLLSLTEQGTIEYWDAATGQEQATSEMCLQEGTCLAVSRTGSIAIATASGKVAAWDAVSCRRLFSVEAHTTAVHRLAFSPDGQKLATASEDQTVRLWDATTGVELLCLRGHTAPVLDVAFTVQGDQLVTASADQTARVWDLRNGKEQLVLRGHLGPVTGVALHPDGRRLVTASGDRTLRVWDASVGSELLTLTVGDPVQAPTFTPDGQRLLGGSADGAVRQW